MKLMMSNISSRKQWLLLLGLVAMPLWCQAEPCQPAPGNEYEKVLCQLKNTGRGEGLPTLYEFRNNPPITQAFLLKKPAERAGIPLRIPERDNAQTVDRQTDLLLTRAAAALDHKEKPAKAAPKPVSVVAVPAPVPAPAPIKAPAPLVAVEPQAAVNPLASCRLQGFALECAQGRFELVTNRSNQSLAEGVLSEEHRLALPARKNESLDEYLQRAYSRYVEGMMEIGLGASTMSYSKFVHLHEHISAQQLDFVERFETMYHFLKLDKASIGVSTKPVIAAGFTTTWCSDLKPELLACEYGRDNYLFVKRL